MIQNRNLFKKTSFKKPENDTKIEKAKQFPIESMYSGSLKKTGHVLMGKCLFHQDDTPSLAIYPDTNTFYCFSCGLGGDAIAFYMKLHAVDFKTAVEDLQ